jgi:signal transduction histidine kinase
MALAWCTGVGLVLLSLLLPTTWTLDTGWSGVLRLQVLLHVGVAVIAGVALLRWQQQTWRYRIAACAVLASNVWMAILLAFDPPVIGLHLIHYLTAVIVPALLIPLSVLPTRRVPRLLLLVNTVLAMSVIDVVVQLIVPRIIPGWEWGFNLQLIEWRWLTTIVLCFWYVAVYARSSSVRGYAAVLGVIGAACFIAGDSTFLFTAGTEQHVDSIVKGSSLAAPFWITQQLCWALALYAIGQNKLVWSNQRLQLRQRDASWSWVIPILQASLLIAFTVVVAISPVEGVPLNVRIGFVVLLGLWIILTIYELTISARQSADLAIEKERTRISGELHDHVKHALVDILWQAQWGQEIVEHDQVGDGDIEAVRGLLATVQKRADEGLLEVHQVVYQLRTLEPELPLSQALKELSEEFRAVETDVTVLGSERMLLPEQRDHLRSIAKEALTNAARYAQGAQVNIRLNYEDVSCVSLVIQDDGPGANSLQPGVGLRNILWRAEQLGGQAQYYPDSDCGFRIVVEVPV